MKAAWPTDTELTDRLEGLGITTLPAGVDAQDMIDAAVEAFERATGYSPFLEGASRTLVYDPPFDYVMDLVGGNTTVTAVELDGVALVSGTDYWTLPPNAAALNQPITGIRFSGIVVGAPQSVEVTGAPGYHDEIPTPAWEAVMAMACQYVILVKNGYIGALSESTSGTVKMKFGGEEGSTVSRLQNVFDTAVARYRKVVVA